MSNELIDPDLCAAPAAAAPEEVPERDWEKASWGALKHLGVAVLISVLTVILMIATDAAKVGTVGFGVATLIAITGAVRGIVLLVQRAIAPGYTASGFIGTVVLGVLLNGLMTLVGAFFAYIATVGVSRGRQLRRFGRVLLPRVEAGGAWSEVELDVDVDDAVRPALARQWRENGRTEHASVAAFESDSGPRGARGRFARRWCLERRGLGKGDREAGKAL